MEKEVFDSVLTADEVDRLLGELKLPDKRAAATRRLCEQGQGHIERILVFAHDCPDIEARQACADVVEALDSAYRTTDRGRQLGSLYREHAEELLPDYWARFRKNPLDHRAVAMLMSADPDNIYKLLGKIGDRHDMARFYLLRIRELSPDKFAAEHIDDHTATGLLLVLADVFPCANHQWNQQVFFGAHRTVGHTYLNVVHICSSEPLHPVSGQPTIIRRGKQERISILPYVGRIEIHQRLVGLFVNNARKVYCFPVDSRDYQSKKLQGRQFWGGSRLRFLETDEGLCQLPKLDISSKIKIPWYVEPYVPTAYRLKMRFRKPKPGESPPTATTPRHADSSALLGRRTVRPAAPMDSSSPTVVILPPRLPDAADRMSRAEADLACDRLGEEIAAEGIARVLDRGQLDRVLEEKKIGNDFSMPILAYDAIIRVEVDVPSLVPEARMTLIDLSHGNVMAKSRCPWPMREDDLSRMVEKCREGLKLARQPNNGKLKVRCLRAENEEKNPRLRSLTNRLELVFQESVVRSPRLVPVHHLEASGAREESLLLLMGLSRLPGGRQFSPQADATIELSVREGDGRGKTFEQTPVEITARVIRGDASGDQSFTVATTVAEFDSAAAKTWEKLSGLLREARPDAATGWLDDLAARRRQAKAELRAAKAIERGRHRTKEYDLGVHRRLAHVEAAVKLDPTLEEAFGEHLQMLKDECLLAKYNAKPERATELAENILTQALHYFDRFGPRAKYRNAALDACCVAIDVSLGRLETLGGMELTSRRLRMVQMAKLVLEDGVKYGAFSEDRFFHTNAASRAATLTIVGRAMKRNGVPPAERQQWVDGILRQCLESEAALPKMDIHTRLSMRKNKSNKDRMALLHQQYNYDEFRWECNDLLVRAAELAVEDVCMERAWKLVAQSWNRLNDKDNHPMMSAFSMNQQLIQRLRYIVMRMDEADRLAEFDRWGKGLMQKPLMVMRIPVPQVDIFMDRDAVSQGIMRYGPMPSYEGTVLRFPASPPSNYTGAIHPLAEGDGRLYFAMNCSFRRKYNNNTISTCSQKIGYVLLDELGKPVGRAYCPKKNCKDVWDGMILLPQPRQDKPLRVNKAIFSAGKLYLATSQRGLLVFDTQTEKWTSFGTEQGLPKENVAAIHPIDDKTLFCAAGETRDLICYKLEIPDGKVTLLHREKSDQKDPVPRMFWRDGEKLMAWSHEGLYEDLLGPKVKFSRPDCGAPYGWDVCKGRLSFTSPINGIFGFISMVEIGGRRFVTRGGLHEFDADGKILKSWWGKGNYHHNYGGSRSFHFPANCPINSDIVFASGDRLVFVKSSSAYLVVWDTKSDMWYGPLSPPERTRTSGGGNIGVVAIRGGLWLPTQDGVLFVSLDEFCRAAKSVKRAMTTAEYRRRQRETIVRMPLLNQAIIHASMREFDAADNILGRIFVPDKDYPQALLLRGQVNDVYCANRPEIALEYYQRLAELESAPGASCMGMRYRLSLLEHLKRWPEALEAVEEINHAFAGRLDPFAQRRLEESWKRIVEQLSEENVKHPAAETSNKEERQTQ